MSNLVLVDSSFFIARLGERVDPLAELQRFEIEYEFAINGIVWAEVLRGRADPHVRDRFDAAFCTMLFLGLTPAAQRRAARLAWEMDRRGDVIPLPDIVIGATALEHGAAVLTFDRHYQKIPGLTALSDLE
ncbi:MAG: PIN domain-containing protein [Opitutaceae bacterium]|jgi:predicted nucleic acid-binding protein|nr:PIN domain-containing protein [Opitutaceae bacterium]